MLTTEKVTADELAALPLFEGEAREAIEWIASRLEVHRFAAGEVTINPGDEVTQLLILLEGEVHYKLPGNAYAGEFIRTAGQAMGVLPFSRMKTAPSRGMAIQDCRIAAFDAALFRELIYRAPILAQRLVSEMTDRTRETTRMQEGTNKLLALGKLSAGLAHELNNPASAAVRSSARLRELLAKRRQYGLAIRAETLPERARELMAEISTRISNCGEPGGMDPLERADREADLADWLDSIGGPGELAADLVDAGLTQQDLAPLPGLAPARVLDLALRILVSDFQMECITRELEEASRRISELVQAVKSYSYMDQAPATETDITQGIDNTLRMFQHQLKQGIQVKREYEPGLPKVPSNGSALNQVWTNLIDNAIGAMQGNPPERKKVLEVRACAEPECVLVEIADSGPGIAKDVQSRIFEPFFTTKPVGEGTGLGLDVVQRIVRAHNGSIRLLSEPGRTVFQVRLPKA